MWWSGTQALRLELEPWARHSPALSPWASYLASRSLSHEVCKDQALIYVLLGPQRASDIRYYNEALLAFSWSHYCFASLILANRVMWHLMTCCFGVPWFFSSRASLCIFSTGLSPLRAPSGTWTSLVFLPRTHVCACPINLRCLELHLTDGSFPVGFSRFHPD